MGNEFKDFEMETPSLTLEPDLGEFEKKEEVIVMIGMGSISLPLLFVTKARRNSELNTNGEISRLSRQDGESVRNHLWMVYVPGSTNLKYVRTMV